MPHSCPMWSPTCGNSVHTSDRGSWRPTALVSVVGVAAAVLAGQHAALVNTAWSGEPGMEEDLHTICIRSASLLHTPEFRCLRARAGEGQGPWGLGGLVQPKGT